MQFNSSGKVQYGPGIRAVVWIDQGIADLYRKIAPKYLYMQPQMYPAHITVVRTEKEVPTNMDVWGKYEGEEIPFTYDNEVHNDGTYYYLRAWSDRIGDIREELGLPRFRFNDIAKNSYHITIGNVKSS